MKRVVVALALVACKAKPEARVFEDAAAAAVLHGDAAPAKAPPKVEWAELARFTRTEASQVIPLPVKTTTPRFDVGGPALANGIAVVSSSQFGFVAVDYRSGRVMWSKPTGVHVAPPLARAGTFVLVGECLQPSEMKGDDLLLGCVRVVNATGGDLSYVAIRGQQKAVQDFANEPGPQHLWSAPGDKLLWKRGEQAVEFDPLTGAATPAPAIAPALAITYKDRTWDVTQDEAGILAATQKGKPAWRSKRAFTELIGAVYLPEQAPMVRVSSVGRFAGVAEMSLFDIDATGSLHGTVAFPVPGIGISGHGIDSVGDAALAIQLDRSLDHHFIVGYAANALLMWVYPLPVVQRPDPIGIGVAPDAVVVFHDGDTLTVLPELSAPPTAPGATHPPSENAAP
ncbi:hypothetical protein BH11MYX1_BH11MYX1_06080 [soil metagenome]